MRPALYCIPSSLGGAPQAVLPAGTLAAVRGLRAFVAEHAKTARAFLAAAGLPCALAEVSISVLDEHTAPAAAAALLAPLRAGQPLGLLSEAGCPAIADPGAALVEAAHREGLPVVPLVGPSSIVLALMASGLEGQRFAFSGYLPRKPDERKEAIVALERRSRRERETEVFIETPYRNDAMVQALLQACDPATRLCFASDLTLDTESIATRTVAEWRRAPASLGKRPTVFLLLCAQRRT